MTEQETKTVTEAEVSSDASPTDLVVRTEDLNKESLQIINNIIAESDIEKTKDLTYLFNINQNKKTMVRVNKLNELLDTIADQTMKRFAQKPDEISNQELLQGLKVVQDIIERGQKQIAGTVEQPLIQVNQQNNEINLGDASGDSLTKESRDRIKNAVLAILQGVSQESFTTPINAEVIDVTPKPADANTTDDDEED